MRVWDVFPYWREQWAIEARQRLWLGYDYTPIALVGDRTHRGSPLSLPEPAGDIEMLSVALTAGDDWGREAQQRDAVWRLHPDLDPDDLILLTDADEIVDPRALPRIVEATEAGPVKLRMAIYMCGTRWKHRDTWRHPGACRARDLPEHPTADLRMNFTLPKLPDCGWHLTYFDEDVDGKLRAFAHAECDTAEFRAEIERVRTEGVGLEDDPLTGPLADILAVRA